MSDIAIRVENLSKRYKIGVAKQRHDTLRDQLTHTLAWPFRQVSSLFRTNGRCRASALDSPPSALDSPPSALDSSTIWALKDVSFEVKQGEVVGIIGRNGAGKSTLLKLLTRITEPTEGRAEIYGRVGSLLEVGTGFHPELTGRENIYLNGAILGMKKAEIDRKFDEIVAFAEVEKFIDTPVKRYSSGMYVRLAFAVAAHLESEILLVDEVLAVGDVAFQSKCLGKMSDVARAGRTVLFVSHNMAVVSNLCPQAILLSGGQVGLIDDTKTVIHKYLSNLNTQAHLSLDIRTDREGNGRLRFTGLRIRNQDGEEISTGVSGQPVCLILEYSAPVSSRLQNVSVSVDFLDMFGQRLFTVGTSVSGGDFEQVPSKGCFICKVPQLLLTEDQYRIDLWASVDGDVADYIQHVATFGVVSTNITGTNAKLIRHKHGSFVMPHSWTSSGAL